MNFIRRSFRRAARSAAFTLTTNGESGDRQRTPLRSTTMSRLGEKLADDVLARQKTLPRKPEAVTLEGEIVKLVPLDLDRDVDALHAASDGRPVSWGERSAGSYDPDTSIWRYMPAGPFRDPAELAAYLRTLLAAPDGLCLCVTDPGSGLQLGVVNYQANFPEHLKIELGGIWYSPVAQRTGANTEATYLMLEHAFALGYRRVEWKCDALNERSRRAAQRLGFTFEGIQDAHYIVKGRNRDTAWFRILEREWPRVQERLREKLSPVRVASAEASSETSARDTAPVARELVDAPDLHSGVPYSYAAVAAPGRAIFTAGACPLDPDGTVVAPGDVAGQARQTLDNLTAALRAAGCGLEDVVKTTVYVASSERSDLHAAWEVVEERFGSKGPPSTLLGVSVLGFTDQLVEIEAVAIRP
jgi:RimJ/RimL family protein N-acetyltransferase/enamine deaminase RidA (YjgF/YER057c/UK114 family)